MESKYEEIRNLMFKLSHLGVWNFFQESGFFIGNAPNRGIRAWQNRIYPKISMTEIEIMENEMHRHCLLYTSDAADDLLCVDLGGRRIIKKKKSL